MAEKVPSTVSVSILEERLFKACQVGDVDTVRRLVPDKVDVNIQRDLYEPMAPYSGLSNDMAPLHVACLYKRLRVVEALLELKADVNIKDCIGRTPLFIACEKIRLDLVQVLLGYGAGACVNDTVYGGETALHVTCYFGKHDILKVLLSADGSPDSASLADVNVMNDSGETPLYYACQNGNVDDAKLLFSRGAEVSDKEEQKKLLRSAREGGHGEMVTYLLEHFADLE